MPNTMEVFRICKTKYAETSFDGEGAFRFGGRWNLRGRRMIYTAGSLALAALEMLVHLDDDSMIFNYSFVSAQIPQELIVKVEDFCTVPENWSTSPTPSEIQLIGDEWITRKFSAVLEVPTSIIPLEKNYLLNPQHPEYREIIIGKPQKFRFDERLKKTR